MAWEQWGPWAESKDTHVHLAVTQSLCVAPGIELALWERGSRLDRQQVEGDWNISLICPVLRACLPWQLLQLCPGQRVSGNTNEYTLEKPPPCFTHAGCKCKFAVACLLAVPIFSWIDYAWMTQLEHILREQGACSGPQLCRPSVLIGAAFFSLALRHLPGSINLPYP